MNDEPFFIDSTQIMEERKSDAVAYDLACAIGALSVALGESDTVEIANRYYSGDELRHARDFLMIARLRPGIKQRFSVLKLRKEISEL